nr:hypothetical protein [Clostridioides sp.]
MDIIETIQMQIDNIVQEKYQNDECKPMFLVSLLENDQILVTCKHLASCLSEVIFPIDKEATDNWVYGLPSLESYIEILYNRTM